MLGLIVSVQQKLHAIRKDTKGATIVEYSALIGLLTVAIIVSVAGVGTWMDTQWDALCGATGSTCN